MTTGNGNREKELRSVRDEIMELKESPLYAYRLANHYNPVIGQGAHNADIMFVGEAPGKNEAEQGRPFCGAAGKILDELLSSISLPREKVYITNILKDRPPGNRDPLPQEIELYAPFLDRQIEAIKPRVLATLGRFSMEYIFKRYGLGDKLEKISATHGKVFSTTFRWKESVIIVPLYHPAVAIYNRNQLDELKKDFEVLKQFISSDTLKKSS